MTIPSVNLDAKFGPTLSGIMFTTIFTVTLQSSIRSFTCCESLPSSQTQSSSKQKRAERLNLTRSSTTQFLRLLSLFGVLITLCYLLENHPPFPHVSKLYDRDWFCSLLLFLGIASVLTYKENKEKGGNVNSEILNRNQTEELKGWMQGKAYAYEFNAASDTPFQLVDLLLAHSHLPPPLAAQPFSSSTIITQPPKRTTASEF